MERQYGRSYLTNSGTNEGVDKLVKSTWLKGIYNN